MIEYQSNVPFLPLIINLILGFTCVTFTTGALSWFGPTYVSHVSLILQECTIQVIGQFQVVRGRQRKLLEFDRTNIDVNEQLYNLTCRLSVCLKYKFTEKEAEILVFYL